MSEQRFIGYIQEPDVHDGVIVTATYKSGFLRSVFDKRVVLVLVLTYEERLFIIRFSRVRSASIINVDGMRLYSLSEMHATPPFRRFVFVDLEEKSNRHCEVVAREIESTEMTDDFVPKDASAYATSFPSSINYQRRVHGLEQIHFAVVLIGEKYLKKLALASRTGIEPVSPP